MNQNIVLERYFFYTCQNMSHEGGNKIRGIKFKFIQGVCGTFQSNCRLSYIVKQLAELCNVSVFVPVHMHETTNLGIHSWKKQTCIATRGQKLLKVVNYMKEEKKNERSEGKRPFGDLSGPTD